MSNPVELTLEMLMQEAQATSKRIIGEDRPDLIFHAGELVDVAVRLARVTRLPPPADAEAFILELKKRFLFATTLPVVAGIYSDEAVATPIDLTPLRHGGTSWLGVGLAEYRHQHEAIDAPRYFPDQVCYGFVVPGTPEETWYMVREKGDVRRRVVGMTGLERHERYCPANHQKVIFGKPNRHPGLAARWMRH